MIATPDDTSKRIPQWAQFAALFLTVGAGSAGTATYTTNRVTENLLMQNAEMRERMIRTEETLKFLSLQMTRIEAANSGDEAERQRIESMIRKFVKPECLR